MTAYIHIPQPPLPMRSEAYAHVSGSSLVRTPQASQRTVSAMVLQVSAKAQCDGQLTVGISFKLLKGRCLHSGPLVYRLSILLPTEQLPKASHASAATTAGHTP